MKLTFAHFLPLLLIACVAEGPTAPTPESASQPAPVQAEAKKPAMKSPPAPTAALPEPKAAAEPTAAPAAVVPPPVAEPTATAPATAVEPSAAVPTTTTTPPQAAPGAQAPGAPTPVAPATGTHTHADGTVHTEPHATEPPAAQGAEQGPPAAPAKVQQPAFQMPTAGPLPLPVVPGPAASVDPLTLSGKNLGGPIQVFDKTISEGDIRRFLCFAVGGKQVDSHKFGVLTEQEIAKRKAAGEDVSKLVVTDAEFTKSLEKTRKDFLLKYPTLDFPTEVGRAFLSLDVYEHELRRTMLFDKVFFPEDPNTWPSLTTEAIILASGGMGFIDDSKEQYVLRKQMQSDQKLEELPPEDPILVDTLRSWVLDSLNQYAQVEFHQDKLPADTLLTVEGTPIKVDEIWPLIEKYVTWENVADARRFLAQMAVVERDLEQGGKLMPIDEFETTFMPGYPFKDALASFEMVAIVLQGFPSMQADLRYERALRSYKNVIADEHLTDEQMAPFLQRANMIAGAAKIDAEVILASAYDYANARWKPEGWKAAEAKARELKQALDAGADWSETLQLHSDFWDPPMPEVGQKPQFGFNFKGRFGEQTKNQLTGDLHESDYLYFLSGTSIADKVFFDQPGGTISDVMKGNRGYYIARINSRKPGQSGLNLKVPQNRDFMVNFVAMQRFGVYARQLLTDAIAKGAVKGF